MIAYRPHINGILVGNRTMSIENNRPKSNAASVREERGERTLARRFAEPDGKVVLLYGADIVFRLSLLLAAQAMFRGETVAVVDGCNRFNAHALARFARQRKMNPDEFLRRIYVSRGFTCYQMEAAVRDRLPAFFDRTGARIGLVFGLLDTMYDEQAPLKEVTDILLRVGESLDRLRAEGRSVLLAGVERKLVPAERNRLTDYLRMPAETVYRAILDGEGKPLLVRERDGAPPARIAHPQRKN